MQNKMSKCGETPLKPWNQARSLKFVTLIFVNFSQTKNIIKNTWLFAQMLYSTYKSLQYMVGGVLCD